MKEKLMYSYVEAIIVIEKHTLIIKRDEKVEHAFNFLMPVDW